MLALQPMRAVKPYRQLAMQLTVGIVVQCPNAGDLCSQAIDSWPRCQVSLPGVVHVFPVVVEVYLWMHGRACSTPSHTSRIS